MGVVRFVDLGDTGGDGSPSDSHLGLAHALQQVPDDTTLIVKAGSTDTLLGDPVVLGGDGDTDHSDLGTLLADRGCDI